MRKFGYYITYYNVDLVLLVSVVHGIENLRCIAILYNLNRDFILPLKITN